MIGLEQTVVPLIGANEFDIQSNALIVSFIASFGLVKAFLNLFAGKISDKWGRKNVLILGWLFGIPVPIILILAPDWNWVIIANVFLGINQGLAWSMTVNMKIDLVGKEKRGFALGFNEFSGYFAVAIVGFITGYIASVYGLKPYPFYLGIIFAVLGLLISWLIVKDTRKFTLLEIETQDKSKPVDENNVEMNGNLKFVQVFLQTSWKNRSLLAISQAGLVNNLIFGVSWGLFTLYFSSYGLSANDIGFLKALHPGIWGVLQLATGFLSDKIGRKILIFPGMFIQSIGVWTILYSQEALGWVVGMSFLGLGTALVYPTLLAAISDIAHPNWRATSLGVYRFWRDMGFVIGAIGIGFIADLFNTFVAIQAVAWIGLASGIVVIFLMKETKT
ncbi:Inner membrane transport protein YnfM [Candidatus Nitrosocosmicus oleophilus]|uniref:Inner membrane transport protein YnfM n=2 Tax=Candidatus Nitrosocosmicus oleophilus TaxID=1353260 RepID=A0A654LT54_9ARCH|nr:Inner membrane transport protein YnfM [Candidatus Nitrosocosmicus oleophilus]